VESSVINPADLEVALSPLIFEALAYLTDGALLSLNEEPVIIPRHSILQKVIASGMPIVPVAGDWGQGKSFIGKLLYRYSAKWRTIYVTYIRFSGIYDSLRSFGKEVEEKFYGKAVPLSKEAIPRDSRSFLSLVLPLIFSPNAVRGVYDFGEDLLTTLPSDKELKPEDYEVSLEDVARRVVEKLDKRYIVILDELEQEPEVFTVDKLGAVLYLMRSIYDKSQNIPKVILTLLIQEFARARFSALLDQLRVHRGYQRAFGAVDSLINLSSITDEEARRYIGELLKRVLGEKAAEFVPEKVVNDILQSVSTLANTRLKASVIRSSLAILLSKYVAHYITSSKNSKLVDELANSAARNRCEILSRILAGIDAPHLSSMIVNKPLLPPKLAKLLSGKLEGFASYADEISRKVAEDMAKKIEEYGFEVKGPESRSSAKGYKAWEIIVLAKAKEARKEVKKAGDIKLRLIVWTRLSRLHKEAFNRDELLAKLKLSENEVKETPTKILLIHTLNVTTAKLQEALYDLLLTVRVDSTLLTALLIRAGGSRDPELAQGLTDATIKSFNEVYEKNFVSKILPFLEPLITAK